MRVRHHLSPTHFSVAVLVEEVEQEAEELKIEAVHQAYASLGATGKPF